MSKFVDTRLPLSDEDKDYLRTRAREGEIAVNERQFGEDTPPELRQAIIAQAKQQDDDGEADEDDALAAADIEWVNSLKIAELRDELTAREAPFDDDSKGDKGYLKGLLLEALAKEDDASEEDDTK